MQKSCLDLSAEIKVGPLEKATLFSKIFLYGIEIFKISVYMAKI